MKRRIVLGLACGLAAISLSACSSLSDCLEPQPYMQAKQLPPLSNPAGLDVPQPNPAMAVPDVASGPVGRYKQPHGPADSAFSSCLVTPPPMSRTGM